MGDRSERLHLLRDGELIEAVVTYLPDADVPAGACAMEVAYQGRRLRAYGTDPADALVALRGALEVGGLFLNAERRVAARA